MKKIVKFLIIVSLILLFSTNCVEALLQTYVRFENRSATKTVKAIWDGISMGDLAPGEKTEYREVNSGNHTIQWKNALNNKDLTTMAWPNLVAGSQSTFPYVDP